MKISKIIFIFFVAAYAISFSVQERIAKTSDPYLSFPLPPQVQKIALGYLRQITGIMHFIKTNVFLGGIQVDYPTETYKISLAENFKTMSTLHPYFLDTYHLCESSLSYIGPEQTRQANEVLKIGMEALPDVWEIPFFIGFNHFHYLNENREAAEVLLKTSKIPGAPDWFGHLASMLAAEGGDIYAGLIWLKAMKSAEEDEMSKERYQVEIDAFEKALTVQKAILSYREKYNRVPNDLQLLIPEFLGHMPQFNGEFVLKYNPPTLKLVRPHRIAQSD